MIGKLSAEWLNGNRAKAYPLADTTGGVSGTLPGSLLVDGCILSETPGILRGYVSGITTTDTGWSMSVSIVYSDTTVDFEDIISVSYDSEPNAVAKFSKCVDGYTIFGSFTIGDASAVSDWSGTTILSEDAGELCLSVIQDISGMFLTGIRVGTTTLTGTVELKAGEGIDIKVDTDSNSIEITNTKYLNSVDMSITNDDELLAAVTDIYGAPIKSINGVPADEAGNINIIVPANESATDEYITSLNTNSPAGTLVLALAKDPCLYLEDIDTAAHNLAELNERAAILDAAVKELDSALNSIATQMTRLS